MRRDLKEFINAVATKCGIEPTRVIRTTWVNQKGLNVIVDDEVIQELPEGQDMTIEFIGVEAKPASPKASVVTDAREGQHQFSTIVDTSPTGYELKLRY